MRDGLVQMADILNIQQVGEAPLLGIEGVPFLVGNPDELKVLQKYAMPEFVKIATKYNQTILYTVPWPTQYIHAKVKTDKLDGLKGLKIRVPDRQAGDMVNALGMVGVQIPGRDGAGAGVGRRCRRHHLVGVGRRRQVLGVPEVLLPDQPRLELADRHHQQRHLEEDLAATRRRSWILPPSSQPSSGGVFEADTTSSKRLIEGGMELDRGAAGDAEGDAREDGGSGEGLH